MKFIKNFFIYALCYCVPYFICFYFSQNFKAVEWYPPLLMFWGGIFYNMLYDMD